MKLFIKAFQDNWPEDEAYESYYSLIGWRTSPEWTEESYRKRRNKDIEYYRDRVFKGEPDAEELIKRYIAKYDSLDAEYREAKPE